MVIVVREENVLFIMASLNNMVGLVRQDDPTESRHGHKCASGLKPSQENKSVTFLFETTVDEILAAPTCFRSRLGARSQFRALPHAAEEHGLQENKSVTFFARNVFYYI